jgi:hypothetical protein
VNESAHPVVEELRGRQFENLLLSWAVTTEPWQIEPAVIAGLQPPLNVDHNSAHPFCATMKAARADCVAGAARWP